MNVLGNMRRWIQWNALNGSRVIWGSNEELIFSKKMTVRDYERLAQEIGEDVEKRLDEAVQFIRAHCPDIEEKRKILNYLGER